jgi:DNA-binding FadR family transcriptional regulator
MTAYAFLSQLVERCRARGERILPPTPQLAAMAGVSRVAIWKAVRRLRHEGMVITRRGGWVAPASGEVSGGPLAPLLSADSGPKWRRLS